MCALAIIPSYFESKGTRCRGDLYLPDGQEKPPVVIMGHGFGAERAFGLRPFAERFVAHGMAAFTFDYRTFGDSEGQPRNFVDPIRHLQDWAAALAHVRTLTQVDSSRIALWGSSFGGGHVLVTAARDQNVTAVVAQVPYVDPITTIANLGVGFLAQGTPHALRDVAHILLRRDPHHIKIIAPPDQFGALNTHDSYSGYSAIIPADSSWENKCPARILLTYPLYRPATAVSRINCPTMIMAGTNDSLIPIKGVRRAAAAIKDCTFIEDSFGHFDVYAGEWFETAVSAQSKFLAEELHAKSSYAPA